MHKNEIFYNFRKLRNVLNTDTKKLVKIGRIADSLSTKKNEKICQTADLKKNQYRKNLSKLYGNSVKNLKWTFSIKNHSKSFEIRFCFIPLKLFGTLWYLKPKIRVKG